MTRLVHPTAGTVIHCEGDLAEGYRAAGWLDESKQEQATSEKPAPQKRPPGRPKK